MLNNKYYNPDSINLNNSKHSISLQTIPIYKSFRAVYYDNKTSKGYTYPIIAFECFITDQDIFRYPIIVHPIQGIAPATKFENFIGIAEDIIQINNIIKKHKEMTNESQKST